MNTVQLIGRLTRDPEVRYSQGSNPLAVARRAVAPRLLTNSGEPLYGYTLAVNRAAKKDNEHPEADFISCVAFGKSGEFAEKWLKKGMRIGVEGRIQTGTFTDKDGIKRKSFDIVVSKHHFCDSKDGNAKSTDAGETPLPESNGFYEVNETMDDDDLPF